LCCLFTGMIKALGEVARVSIILGRSRRDHHWSRRLSYFPARS
jgi:hypothetical protein